MRITSLTGQSECGRLRRVAIKHVDEAWSEHAIDREWRDLNFTARPVLGKARDEFECFAALVARCGADLVRLPAAGRVGLDSIYVRDASIVCARGVILGNMGKPQRRGEPAAQRAAFERAGIAIAGAIEDPGRLEGGDVLWLDEQTIAVGRGYRTNDEGIGQLRSLVGVEVEVVTVPLPHWKGPADVFHLMSIISSVDRDLAVVYSPLLPVPFREFLIARGYDFVEVPAEEFDSMGANVLAIAPRVCVMVSGNPRTRAALERAGAQVYEYDGTEISLKGGGGPTCLTRPLVRDNDIGRDFRTPELL